MLFTGCGAWSLVSLKPARKQRHPLLKDFLSACFDLTLNPRIEHAKNRSRHPARNVLRPGPVRQSWSRSDKPLQNARQRVHAAFCDLLRARQSTHREEERTVRVVELNPLQNTRPQHRLPHRAWRILPDPIVDVGHPVEEQGRRDLSHAVKVHIERAPTHTGTRSNTRGGERFRALECKLFRSLDQTSAGANSSRIT